MSLKALAPEECEVVRRTMATTFRYFDVDFHTRLGVSPEAMDALLKAWPAVDDSGDESDVCLAINNSFNDLLHGIGISESEAMEQIGVDRTEMLRIYRKWVTARGRKSAGVQNECFPL